MVQINSNVMGYHNINQIAVPPFLMSIRPMFYLKLQPEDVQLPIMS